jgi:hypothetical protein
MTQNAAPMGTWLVFATFVNVLMVLTSTKFFLGTGKRACALHLPGSVQVARRDSQDHREVGRGNGPDGAGTLVPG